MEQRRAEKHRKLAGESDTATIVIKVMGMQFTTSKYLQKMSIHTLIWL